MNAPKDLYILIAISFDTLCGTARIYCYEKSCQEANWNSKRKNLLISVWGGGVVLYALPQSLFMSEQNVKKEKNLLSMEKI